MKDHRESLQPGHIDHSWTLFIDRDGVINQKRDDDYVKTWEEFIFIPGSLEGLKYLATRLGRMIIVTNQRGVGRKIMTEATLFYIHEQMMSRITEAEGRIDKIYYCPHLEEDDHEQCRKPKPGMGLKAKADFPEIDFRRSVMIGDALSDMKFGRKLGMKTVWVSDQPPRKEDQDLIDMQVNSIYEFAQWLGNKVKSQA
ncbi:MAG: HAD family hydrolase [Bacteroidia bacterium]|nr:HAD family hydrolase [Bacteroidia bacterium]